EHARGRGAARLRAAVAQARERVWSPQETHMHLMLRDRGWPPPALNHEIVDPATGIVYYVDLAYPQQRIAIEYDGSDHVTDPDRVTHDHHKSTALTARGGPCSGCTRRTSTTRPMSSPVSTTHGTPGRR